MVSKKELIAEIEQRDAKIVALELDLRGTKALNAEHRCNADQRRRVEERAAREAADEGRREKRRAHLDKVSEGYVRVAEASMSVAHRHQARPVHMFELTLDPDEERALNAFRQREQARRNASRASGGIIKSLPDWAPLIEARYAVAI